MKTFLLAFTLGVLSIPAHAQFGFLHAEPPALPSGMDGIETDLGSCGDTVNQVLKILELSERACKLRTADPKCLDRAKRFAFKNWRLDQAKIADRFAYYTGLCKATDSPDDGKAAVGNHEECWSSFRKHSPWADDREIIKKSQVACTVVAQLWNTRRVTGFSDCIEAKNLEQLAAAAH